MGVELLRWWDLVQTIFPEYQNSLDVGYWILKIFGLGIVVKNSWVIAKDKL